MLESLGTTRAPNRLHTLHHSHSVVTAWTLGVCISLVGVLDRVLVQIGSCINVVARRSRP